MLRLTSAVGVLLVLTGVIAFLVSDGSSVTALIPAFVGLLLLAAALVGRNDGARKHAVHAAMVIALLGLAGSLMNTVQIGEVFAGTAERPTAIVTSAIMFVLLAVYLALGIRSFVLARRARTAPEIGADGTHA